MRWSEGLVVVLAVAGAAAGWRRSGPSRSHATFWTRYLACDVAIAAAIFSLIPYKTPWNLLPFYVVAFALAGVGLTTLLEMARSRALRGVLVGAFAIGSCQLGWQAWRAAVIYAADPRNPYVYAQTVPDAVRMATRILDLSRLHANGAHMEDLRLSRSAMIAITLLRVVVGWHFLYEGIAKLTSPSWSAAGYMRPR